MVRKGYELGVKFCEEGIIKIEVERDEKVKDEVFLIGMEVVGIGVFVGGMDFLSFYFMSLLMGVLIFVV